ncbi:c-type cytochrome biogenesis protein CcsB [Chamaesiphon polymorphus]|uniref:Cytochrome c biogenesis protein CcsA n=1 Tax=Chamaesiphon polymorphus CCALA 037 TaxID=2107692 RepID=A0A2T1GHK7_9CYAN|nr:c-type cytochrome biogenesis protein CcsB [Chamaesiphon polymorphus]PSB57081.1 c-type cytochrome biogenesis protein CcsB [Chamaesiphon polymorphus CCALA 037]
MNLVSLQNQLDNLSFGILFVTMLIYWVGAAFPKIPLLQNLGTTGMAVANLCIAALLSARWIEAGYFPLSNLYESLFFLTWGITAMHLFAETISRSALVGVVTAPVAMLITAFAALKLPDDMQASAPLVPALKSNWLMMHVSVMMLSYATLLVGSVLAIAFLFITRGQEIELRGSSFGGSGYRLTSSLATQTTEPATTAQPMAISSKSDVGNTAVLELPAMSATATLTPQRLSLADTLDNISYRIIGLGFPLLTIGIIAGGVWANEAWGSYWSWDPKETWALIVWLVFAAYLHSRITKGWQGRKPAILASVGFVVVWICYLGVNLLGKGLHSYGWFL